MFANIDNEKKMAIILKTLLSKMDKGNNIKEIISKTIDIDTYDNDDIYHKYIETEISTVMFDQALIPYKHPTELGFGTFGNVYKLKHSLDGEYYAIKRILIDNTIDDIIHEVKIMARLTYHPNIVKYHHSWLDDKRFLGYEDEETGLYLNIQLELCDHTLREYMCSYIYDDDSIKRVNIWKQLISAIKHLHDFRVIHRDIKPSNIFIKNNVLKLGDFGLSRAYDNEQSYSIEKSVEVGCSYYRAPEIDSGIYNETIDVYSAGIILLELLLNYKTMMEKDKLVRKMLNTGIMPILLDDNYKPLLLKTICDSNNRYTIYDVDNWLEN